jgi:DNA ligase (NAD+)
MARGKKTRRTSDGSPAAGVAVEHPDGAVETRMRELADELRRHKQLYYNAAPQITDEEYDALEAELVDLEAAYPELKEEDSPTDLVGAPAETSLFDPVRHERAMASLAKAFTAEELEAFFARFPGERLALMPKFDGTSLSLLYEGGRLVRAATRGDGEIGEDVTANVAGMKGVPETMPSDVDVEVRGEVVMAKSDFDAYNAANPGKPLKNTRNAAAGTLRAKDRAKVADRPLTFIAFSYHVLSGGELPGCDSASLEGFGFRTERYEETDDVEAVAAYIEAAKADRASLDYDIDGVVIRLADAHVFADAGETGHHPKGAVAFKLPAELGETALVDVLWQVGKSGIVAPVAAIQPVFLAGTTIGRATLHNMAMIDEKGIMIGDRIQIRRAGDVIPHVDGVAPGFQRSGNERPIVPPAACPSCGGSLVEIGSSRVLQCQNAQGCSAQQTRRLIHWASRSASDIDAIGQSWIDRLGESGMLRRPSDFYRITEEQLLALDGDGMGERLAEKMVESITAAKNVGLRKALVGFSIPLCSEGTAKRLCRAGYASVEQVAGASQQELENVEDIGPAVAASIVSFFSDPAMVAELADLRALGVNLDVLPDDAPVVIDIAAAGGKEPPFYGKAVCITGKLTVDRGAFQKLVEKEGAKAVSGVSAKTDFLIAGPDIIAQGSSKLKNAEKFGVTVLTEDEARAMLVL